MTSLTTYKSPVPDRVYVPRSVLRLIEEEARRGSATSLENETGGILIGRRLEGANRMELLIVAATGPGEKAYHHPVEFNPDIDYVNRKLQEYHTRYPRTDYIGTWHKHPPRYPQFSSGDVATAHAVFRDSAYKVDEIINPIVWVDQGKFTIRYYYMSRQMARQAEPFYEVQEPRIMLIDDDHPYIQREAAANTTNGAANDRIGEEYRLLSQRGYQVKLQHEGAEYFFEVRDERYHDLVIYLVAPVGFPQVPPTLMVERGGEALPPNDGGVINQWTYSKGAAHLVEVADGVIGTLNFTVAPAPAPVPTPAFAPVPKPESLALPPPLRPVRAAPRKEAVASPQLIAVLALVLVVMAGITGWFFTSRGQTAVTVTPQSVVPKEPIITPSSGAASTVAQPALTTQPTQTIEAEWATLKALPPEKQIARLLVFIDEGRVADPHGTPSASLLHEARLARVKELLAQQPPDFLHARATADDALREAATDPTHLESASDSFVSVLVAEAKVIKAANPIEAESVLNSWPASQDGQLSLTVRSNLAEARQAVTEAKGRLDQTAQLALAWQSYDAATQSSAWDQAVRALDSIVTLTSINPDPALFRSPPNDPRLLGLAGVQAQTRLSYARVLWPIGNLEAAHAQIAEALKIQTFLPPEVLTKITSASETQDRAEALWSQVNQAFTRKDWAAALTALRDLEGLDGFGKDAVNPQRPGQTVAILSDKARTAQTAAQEKPAPAKPTIPPVDTAATGTAQAVASASAVAATAEADQAASATEVAAAATAQSVKQTAEAPPRLKYAVNVAEISAEEMIAANNGTLPPVVNTLLVGPDNVGISVGGVQVALGVRFTLISGVGDIKVAYAVDRSDIDTVGGHITPEIGKFYKVTVAKVE